jgi:SAM-dependent methyltransferase
VEYQVMDAERMPLADDSVDGVVCRWGYMLMADPAAALAETRRVLRDDGTLGFVVWQTPDRNMWAAVPAMTLVQRGHMPPPEPGAPGIFAMGDRDRIVELVTGAGFPEPRIEELTFEWNYGAGDVWDTINRLAGPIAAVIKQLSAQEQQDVREAIDASFEAYRDGDNVKVPAACWGVVTS